MKKISRLLFFPGLLFMIIIGNFFLDPVKLYDKMQIHSRNRNFAGILAQRQNIDVLVLGDSEGYTTISPLQIWYDHGIPVFNGSMTGQNIVETISELSTAVKKHDIKVVLLETNLLFRYAGDMKTDQLVLAEKLYQALPVLRYHSSWKTLFYTAEDQRKEHYWSKGFHVTTGVAYQDVVEKQEESSEVSVEPRNLRYLDKLLELCRANDIQLVCYSSPSPLNYSPERIACLRGISEKEQIPYVNLLEHMEEMGLDLKTESYDGGDHLNVSGGVKVTKFMGNYLAEHYKSNSPGGLEDHRKDPAYAEWNEETATYRKNIRRMLRRVKKNIAAKEAKETETSEEGVPEEDVPEEGTPEEP